MSQFFVLDSYLSLFVLDSCLCFFMSVLLRSPALSQSVKINHLLRVNDSASVLNYNSNFHFWILFKIYIIIPITHFQK